MSNEEGKVRRPDLRSAMNQLVVLMVMFATGPQRVAERQARSRASSANTLR